MPASRNDDLVITGIGVTSAIGHGRAAFTASLLRGDSAFGVMRRPGRQHMSEYLGAEMGELPPSRDTRRALPRNTSLSTRAALAVVEEAWHDALLDEVAAERIGLIVGGSNLQQREIEQLHAHYAGRVEFLRPSYGLAFMDTDVAAHCCERFGIRGIAFTLGGASASGQLAVVQAAEAVLSGRVDVCIAVGALMDLSYWECQAFRAMGAMGSDRFAAEPSRACRPFDRSRDGFIFGEACGAVVIERGAHRAQSATRAYAHLAGWSVVMDAHRGPEPSLEGEVAAIRDALSRARLYARDIDYVNPHGSGSVLGDEVEAAALVQCGLGGARINATKSIVGHALSAAGVVEIVATLVQMQAGTLHPSRNLDAPLRTDLDWVGSDPVPHTIGHALTLSMGFGGTNTALCLRRAGAPGRA